MTARLRSLAGALILVAIACGGDAKSAPFEITRQFPHDPTSYTQGLLWSNDVLYESTGRYGHSKLRKVDPRTGNVLADRDLPSDRFGEGLALYHGTLYQLTWESGVAYTYDASTLAPRDSFKYAGEGWGLTTVGDSLVMSDGSDSLRVLSPATFKVLRVTHVTYNGAPVKQINELEYVNGDVLANVYQTNWVLRIDPATGTVRELLDFSDLYPKRAAGAEVMNGIALSPEAGRLLVTGKLWPVLFEVRLVSSSPAK